MKTAIRLTLLAAFVCLLTPTFAYAQFDNGGYTGADTQTTSDPCPGAMTPDQCMGFAPMPDPTLSGNYYFCQAKGSVGGTCASTAYDANNRVVCVTVKLAAACQCTNGKATGMCTYQP